MNLLTHSLCTASIMLTIACALAAIFFRCFQVQTPRVRQFVLAGALLQGLMLIRLPIELPWLEAPALDVVALETATRLDSLSQAGDELPAFEIEAFDSADNMAVMAPSATSPTSASWSDWIVPLLVGMWMLGVVCVVGRGILRYLKLCRLVDLLPSASAEWFEQWEQVCRRQHRVAPQMFVSETAGPMLVRRPRGYALVVPRSYWDSLRDDQRRGVLLHELAHLCRRDVWRQAFVRLSASLHWWNPAAWWCVGRFEESAEWACDEFLTRSDPRAARGLASSLVRLVEHVDSMGGSPPQYLRGLGVQSMAAPPLTERVSRLLTPLPSRDSTMKRLFFGALALGLVTLSLVQFRLVSAPQQAFADELQERMESELQVLAPDAKEQIDEVVRRLDTTDPASATLAKLLQTDAGKIALVGMLDNLADRERETAQAEAIPRFFEQHFEETTSGNFKLRTTSDETAKSWINRSNEFGDSMASLSNKLQSIGERLEDKGEVNLVARRMLNDEQAAAAMMIVEFEGRIDPIERFLDEAMEKVLVRRGNKLIVLPNLSGEASEHLDRFERATKIFAAVRRELPIFAKEFATPDDRHKKLVAAMNSPALAAIISMEVSEDVSSPTAAVDQILEHLEGASRETSLGLVIAEEESWARLGEMMESADRAASSVAEVQERMRVLAGKLDLQDPASARFARMLGKDSDPGNIDQVAPYVVAAEIPYAEMDLAETVEDMLTKAMQETDGNRLSIREEMSDEVIKKATEILGVCRKLRRYLRQMDSVIEKLEDRDLAQALSGPGRMVLLSDIRRSIEEEGSDPMSMLMEEMFEVSSSDKLRVKPDRADAVRVLAQRADELKDELANDDF